jgi:glycosyltransferase involved in cell wall biosynthesis
LECFGLIVLEAFAAGTPVIASRSGAIPEIAGRQGEDWLFDPGNDQQLAIRMRRFLTGDLPCTANLRQIAEEFDREKVLARWGELIGRC